RTAPCFVLPDTRAPTSTPFPYTTLFRSEVVAPPRDRRDQPVDVEGRGRAVGVPDADGRRCCGARPLRALQECRHLGPLPWSSSRDRKSTRLNSSHVKISYAVFCLTKKKT